MLRMKSDEIRMSLPVLLLVVWMFVGEAEVPLTREQICRQPALVGREDGVAGRAYFPRWYYNPAEMKCLQFIYGGIWGNNNNFQSEEECMKFCEGVKPE